MIIDLKIADFYNRFTVNNTQSFTWQTTSIQIYDLNFINKYIDTPTPIYKTAYYCFIFLKSGRITQQFGATTLEINAPAFVIILDEIAQSIKHIDPESEGYVIVSEQQNLMEILNPIDLCKLYEVDNVLGISNYDANWLNALILLMQPEIEKKNVNKNILESLFKTFIHKVLELSDCDKKFDTAQMIAVEFKKLVFKNYSVHHTISFYAQRLKVSENYLNKCVKSVFNKTPKQLLIEIVIQQSKFLLLDESKNVAEVSFDVNFDDPSYFTRIFKKVTGVTPSKFREQFTKDLSLQ